MHPGTDLSITLTSAEATARFAARLAPHLRPGDTLLLRGGLGAGKTHFARSLIQSRLAAAGFHEDVPSPTFTLVQTYTDGAAEFWHCDLYRLSELDELQELGIFDALQTAICLIEWPERLGGLAPDNALWLHLGMVKEPGVRTLTAQSSDPRWAGILSAVVTDPHDD